MYCLGYFHGLECVSSNQSSELNNIDNVFYIGIKVPETLPYIPINTPTTLSHHRPTQCTSVTITDNLSSCDHIRRHIDRTGQAPDFTDRNRHSRLDLPLQHPVTHTHTAPSQIHKIHI